MNMNEENSNEKRRKVSNVNEHGFNVNRHSYVACSVPTDKLSSLKGSFKSHEVVLSRNSAFGNESGKLANGVYTPGVNTVQFINVRIYFY